MLPPSSANHPSDVPGFLDIFGLDEILSSPQRMTHGQSLEVLAESWRNVMCVSQVLHQRETIFRGGQTDVRSSVLVDFLNPCMARFPRLVAWITLSTHLQLDGKSLEQRCR